MKDSQKRHSAMEAVHLAEFIGVNYFGNPEYSKIDYNILFGSQIILKRYVRKQHKYIVMMISKQIINLVTGMVKVDL